MSMYVTVATQNSAGEIDLSTLPVKDLNAGNVQDFVDALQPLMEDTIVGVTVNIERHLVVENALNSTQRATEIAGFEQEIPLGVTGTINAKATVSGEEIQFENPFNLHGLRGEVAGYDALLATFLKTYAGLGGHDVTGVRVLKHYDLAGFAAMYGR